jgi:hypothetical protein
MRFHYGLGVGHAYSHRPGILESLDSVPHLAAQTDGEFMGTEQSLTETTHWQHPADEEDEEDDEHVGVEESFPFEQRRNGSTETLIEALEEMYTTDHALDYEN